MENCIYLAFRSIYKEYLKSYLVLYPITGYKVIETDNLDLMTEIGSDPDSNDIIITEEVYFNLEYAVKEFEEGMLKDNPNEILVSFYKITEKNVFLYEKIGKTLVHDVLSKSKESFTIDIINLIEKRKNKNKFALIQSDIKIVNNNLYDNLIMQPHDIYFLSSRQFEELIADLFVKVGYKVELTNEGSDGGVDIYATKYDKLAKYLFAIECKKYAPENKVGRPIIQKLYGIVEQKKLSGGIIATSSFYTQPAIEFSKTIDNRIFLRDYFDIMELIKQNK